MEFPCLVQLKFLLDSPTSYVEHKLAVKLIAASLCAFHGYRACGMSRSEIFVCQVWLNECGAMVLV